MYSQQKTTILTLSHFRATFFPRPRGIFSAMRDGHENHHLQRSLQRLLTAVDRALAANKEVESARQDLTRAAERTPKLRVVLEEVNDDPE